MPPKTNEDLVETAAKRIYEVMPYDLPGIKPEWVEGGNSLMQSIARGCASGILTTLLTEKEQELQKARADTLKEVIEIIESVQVTAQKMSANDTRPEKAKLVNDWLMPEVKRNIIKAIQSELDQPITSE